MTENSVNWCRRTLFNNGKSVRKIPQTKNVLIKHIKRTVYQAGYVTEAAIKRCSAEILYFQFPINNKDWFGDFEKSLKYILHGFFLSKFGGLQIVNLPKNKLMHKYFSTILPNVCFTKHLLVTVWINAESLE